MAYATFHAFTQDFFQLYGQKQYEQALALLEPQIERFPADIRRARNWQACMLALLGRPEEALAALQAGLDAGAFYPAHELLADPDFASMQDLPAFQAIVQTCRDRAAEAQESAVPQRLLVGSVDAAHPVLMALHGNGHNAAETLPYWEAAAQAGWSLAVLQSSQVAASDAFVWDDRDRAVREVTQHYAELQAQAAPATVIGGFSMGAGTAIWAALSQAIPAQGFVALAPWLPDTENLRALMEACRGSGLRGVIMCGELDDICIKTTHEVAAMMAEYGLACQVELIANLHHNYPADFGTRLTRALRWVLAR